jgi:hypothetical protein
MPRSSTGCVVCKARKASSFATRSTTSEANTNQVKCDEDINGCKNCQRLGVACPGYSAVDHTQSDKHHALTEAFKQARLQRRQFGACERCRESKVRCSRGTPSCDRCKTANVACHYATDQPRRREATAARKTSLTSSSTPQPGEISHAQNGFHSSASPRATDQSPGLEVPRDTGLRVLLADHFFNEVAPLRCLGFIHKPTFMRALNQDNAESQYTEALVVIIFALGAS